MPVTPILPLGPFPIDPLPGALLPDIEACNSKSLPAGGSGGYGASGYGPTPYGSVFPPSVPAVPADPVGYGYGSYGFGSYGSIGDTTPPFGFFALSINGTRIEVYFNQTVKTNAAFFDAANYVLTPVTGGVPITVMSVNVGVTSPVGANSAILMHSGSTLGGVYRLEITALENVAGTPIDDGIAHTNLIAQGDIPTVTAIATSGDTVQVTYDTPMLTEAERAGGTGTVSSYGISAISYPVTPTIEAVEHPVGADPRLADLTLSGMTSATYQLEISPATSIEYNGNVLPNFATQFQGTELGTGSSIINGNLLLLSKSANRSYGWNFRDLTGKFIPDSSYRCDVTFDASSAIFAPPLNDCFLFGIHISDSQTLVSILPFDHMGTRFIRVLSGDYDYVVPFDWASGVTTLTWLRNDQAQIWALLANGQPLLSAPFTGGSNQFPNGDPVVASSVQFVLGSFYEVDQFPLHSVSLTSSQTVFSNAWNFLHNVTTNFTGSAALALDTLYTEKGPLVKDWGSMVPATTNDVAVRVNGSPVQVSEVNPYIGEIKLAIPIPRLAPGNVDVEVDYTWFPNPTFSMSEYNKPGLVYNKYDARRGRNTTTTTNPVTGGADFQRFPYSIVYGPQAKVPEPLHIGHRYIGFEKEYAAALNSPCTLLYNSRKFGESKSYARTDVEPTSITLEFTGAGLPEEWATAGEITISSNVSSYTLQDPSWTHPGFVNQIFDLEIPNRVSVATRLSVSDYTLDGVWSGISFGFHDNRRLFLCGALVVNGMEHMGFLLNSDDPSSPDSWKLGPQFDIAITTSNIFEADLEDVPSSLGSGDRFQILGGSQQGIYTVDEVFRTASKAIVTITGSFPADPNLFGNRDFTAIVETQWSGSSFYWRIDADTETNDVLFVFGGTNSGRMVLTDAEFEPAIPADFPAFDLNPPGQIFWGSLSNTATNTTTWTLLRAETLPKGSFAFSRGTVLLTDFDNLQEQGWYPNTPFGVVRTNDDQELLLRSIAASETGDASFAYVRKDPFLSTQDITLVDTWFRLDNWTEGSGSATVRIRDTKREVLLGALAYKESGTRSLVQLPWASLSSVNTPENQGWINTGLTTRRENTFIDITKATDQSGNLTAQILGGTESGSSGNKILTTRLAITSYTADGAGVIGLTIGIDAGVPSRSVELTWLAESGATPPRVALTSGATTVLESDFDWTDGSENTYQVLINATANLVDLEINDVVVASASLTSFSDPGYTNQQVTLRSSTLGVGYTARVREISGTIMEPPGVLKTLGVLVGDDPSDIDSWEVPRSDSFDVPNSNLAASVIPMDWSVSDGVKVRLQLDPTFGLVVERPDIPLPPGHDGSDFSTRATNPTRGWIVVEYRNLPYLPLQTGSIAFGSLGNSTLSDQKWNAFGYRILTEIDEDYVAPYHQVYNQYNVITSGELNFDTTPEVIALQSVTSTIISLRPAHIYAARVFSVIEGDTLINPTTWEFDADSQTILLTNPLPSAHHPVTVVFSPGKPVTTTYLQNQPLNGSVTLLNEGTPPVPKSQIQALVRTISSGSAFNDSGDLYNEDPPGGMSYNDTFQYVDFDCDAGTYEDLEFFEVTNGGWSGQISSICDGPAPGLGLREIELANYKDCARVLHNDEYYQGGGGVGAVMILGGGTPVVRGTLNTAVLHTSAPSTIPGASPVYRTGVRFDIQLRAPAGGPGQVTVGNADVPLIEVFTDMISDSFAPTGPPSDDPNPSTGPFPNGAVWYRLTTITRSFPRLGPDLGLSFLEPNSLLYGSSTSQPSGVPPSGDGLETRGGSPIPVTYTVVDGILSN